MLPARWRNRERELARTASSRSLILKRLGQKFDGARPHSLHRHRNVAITRDENNGNLEALRLLNFVLKIQTAHSRKTYIQYQTTGTLRRLSLQKLFGRLEAFGAQASRFQ